ncbi:MAG: outer membrane protein assembly factor BamB family protein [Allosphingosinicella sp.]
MIRRRDFLAAAPAAFLAGAFGSTSAFAQTSNAAGWPRYGYDLANTRWNRGERIIGRDNVARLERQWSAHSAGPIQACPIIADGLVIYGAHDHGVHALDGRTGGRRWRVEPPANRTVPPYEQGIRASFDVHDGELYFIDSRTVAHCLDLVTGRERWATQLDAEAAGHMATSRHAPAVHGNFAVFGHAGYQPQIACLDTRTGRILWRFYTGHGSLWTSAAIDEEAGIVYNVTGDTKGVRPGDPALYSESIIAQDLESGELLWFRQLEPADPYNLDFSCHPVLFDAAGPNGSRRKCVGAGNKRGFYVWDRLTGEYLWRSQLTPPSMFGGPQADSTAFAYNRIYLLSNAFTADQQPTSVAACLNAYTGDIEWWAHNRSSTTCGVAVANGVFYVGLADGLVRAFDAATGAVLWEDRIGSTCRGVVVGNGMLYAVEGEVYIRDQLRPEGYRLHAYGVEPA